MLTGFHGAHVTLGTFMLIVMFFRSIKGHFDNKEENVMLRSRKMKGYVSGVFHKASNIMAVAAEAREGR